MFLYRLGRKIMLTAAAVYDGQTVSSSFTVCLDRVMIYTVGDT